MNSDFESLSRLSTRAHRTVISKSVALHGSLILFLVPNAWAAQGRTTKRLRPEHVVNRAESFAPQNSQLREKVRRAKNCCVVVFIPGLMGSKLAVPKTNPTKVIWGGGTGPAVSDLRLYPKSEFAHAEKLLEYPLGVSRRDVYGEFDRILANVVGGMGEIKEFSYDWRHDINQLTEEFEKRVQGDWKADLQDKRLIVIAHFMGGLIAWNWKNRFYEKRPYTFDWVRLILLGSPLQGSCEMLRTLLTGYRPISEESGLNLAKVDRFFFGELHAAAFTFPSVFQLLPSFELPTKDGGTPCLVIQEVSGDLGQNHFSVFVWERFFPMLKTEMAALNMSDQSFRANLSTLLGKAEDFRDKLDLYEGKLSGLVTYFYSSDYKTIFQIRVDPTKSQISIDPNKEFRGGDGRVVESSAINKGKEGETGRSLQLTHGALVKDVSFHRYLRKELERQLRLAAGAQALKSIAGDAEGLSGFAKSRSVVALSDFGVDFRDPRDEELVKAITVLNEVTLRHLKGIERDPPGPSDSLAKFAFSMATDLNEEEKKPEEALPLYEFAIASGELKGGVDEVYAFNGYGEGLSASREYHKAISWLARASHMAEPAPQKLKKGFLSRLWKNLGDAFKNIGDLPQATLWYNKAKDEREN